MKAYSKFNRLVKEKLVLIAFGNKESLKRRNVDEGSGQFYRPVQESLVLIAYGNSESLKK